MKTKIGEMLIHNGDSFSDVEKTKGVEQPSSTSWTL